MSDTRKQQFTANQSVYQLSDKDSSVLDDIDLWRSVWTRLYGNRGNIVVYLIAFTDFTNH